MNENDFAAFVQGGKIPKQIEYLHRTGIFYETDGDVSFLYGD